MPVTTTRVASSMQICTLAMVFGPVADHGSIPAHAAPVALARAIAGDPVVNPFKTTEFLDVEVDQTTRFLVVIAHNRFWWGPCLSSATVRHGAAPGRPWRAKRRFAAQYAARKDAGGAA